MQLASPRGTYKRRSILDGVLYGQSVINCRFAESLSVAMRSANTALKVGLTVDHFESVKLSLPGTCDRPEANA